MQAVLRRKSGYIPGQSSFSFFDQDQDVQQQALFAQAQEAELKRRQKREIRARERIAVVIAEGHRNGLRWHNDDKLLEAPLGYYEPSDLDVQPDVQEVEEPTVIEDKQEWSDASIVHLHDGLLNYSLRILRTNGNSKEKREIIEWIWSDDLYEVEPETLDGKPRRNAVHRDQIPFTFQCCCRLSGLDYEALREGLAWEMREILPKLGIINRT